MTTQHSVLTNLNNHCRPCHPGFYAWTPTGRQAAGSPSSTWRGDKYKTRYWGLVHLPWYQTKKPPTTIKGKYFHRDSWRTIILGRLFRLLPPLPIIFNEDVSGDRVPVWVQCCRAAANKDPEPGVVNEPDRHLHVDGITQEVDSRTPLIKPVTWTGSARR